MKDLIAVTKKTIGKEEVNAVDARDLYEFLEVKKQFTDWIRPKIKEYGFVINSDFYPSTCISTNGREMETYILSIDMAKELSMISNVPKGKEARKYFIECERRVKELAPQLPQNYLEALKALTSEVEAKEKLQVENKQQGQKLIEQAPKVLFADAVETSYSSILIGELAKLIRQNGIKMGQNRLFSWMRDYGFLIRRKGPGYNMPTQRSVDMSLMEIKIRTIVNPDGSVRETKTPKITGKGQTYFVNRFFGDEKQTELF